MKNGRVSLTQLVRFLVVELTHLGSNHRFDRDALLMTDFMNLKIKTAQSFRGTHSSRVCVFIGMSARTYISICVCTVFQKKEYVENDDMTQIVDAVYLGPEKLSHIII
jgi:hypothetical protein